MPVLLSLSRLLAASERASAIVSGAILLAVMAIVVVDVLLRYFFNAPLSWSFDLISLYLMTAAFFLAASDTQRLGHHVRVDILFSRFPPLARQLSVLTGWVLACVPFAICAKLAMAGALSRLESGDVIAGAIPWPTWVPPALEAFGFTLLTVRLALGAVGTAIEIATGDRSLAPMLLDETAAVEDTL